MNFQNENGLKRMSHHSFSFYGGNSLDLRQYGATNAFSTNVE